MSSDVSQTRPPANIIYLNHDRNILTHHTFSSQSSFPAFQPRFQHSEVRGESCGADAVINSNNACEESFETLRSCAVRFCTHQQDCIIVQLLASTAAGVDDHPCSRSDS